MNWERLMKDAVLSDDVIQKYADILDWNYLVRYQQLSINVLKKYKDRINWNAASFYQVLPESIIIDNIDKIGWASISNEQLLSKKFMDKYADYLFWDFIVQKQEISEEFIEKHIDRIDCDILVKCRKLSDDFIRRNAKRFVHWSYVAEYQKIPIDVIADNLHTMENYSYRELIACQELSDDIIESIMQYDLNHYVDIVKYQNISDQFMSKYDDLYCEEYYYSLAVVHYCGEYNRPIYILKDNPNKIYIGCFYGTQEEAIKAINKKYNGKEAKEYVSKVNKCFELAKIRNSQNVKS